MTAEGRPAFLADRKTQSAVLQQLAIIGEAVRNLSPALTARESTVPWRQIAATRNRLVHACFKVDLEAVWSMVEQDLPPLRRAVERVLEASKRS